MRFSSGFIGVVAIAPYYHGSCVNLGSEDVDAVVVDLADAITIEKDDSVHQTIDITKYN